MSSGLVDLRSDTVTRPTPEMRRAMADAEVGDDAYGEDPTVNELEAEFADRVGKPAALLVPSGTMANQLALRVLSVPGTCVLAGRRQHVVAYENAAAGVNASVQLQPVSDEDGVLAADDVSWARRASRVHQPQVSLICVENTHMAAGGVPWSLDDLGEVSRAAGDVPLHMDGARLFNAEVATSTPSSSFTALVTTSMSCLSKGLCAPVGSVLAGPEDVIGAARVERARMGGGMRQAGVIAAAGLVGLRRMVERLAEDHDRAARLAEAVADRWPESACDPERVRTNIVIFSHPQTDAVLEHLKREGVLADCVAPGLLRLVTHHDVDDPGVERAARAIACAP